MKRTIFLVALGIIISSLPAFGQQVYRWTDEKGTIHLTDDPALVPEKFRDQIKEKELPKEPAPPAPSKPSKGVPSKEVPPKPESKQAPVKPQTKQAPVKEESTPAPQKDLLGRGEDWWRTRVREWNEKLLTAQKNYESAHAEWKSKEKELEQSKFKPDSLKRKLKAEIQTLDRRAKDFQSQIAEAKNMLEKTIPKEAEQYRANPNWLKVEK